MRTENEIKALPLLEQQKLVVELRAVKPGEKEYPNAKAIIELITSLKKWKEPGKLKVKNISGHEVAADLTKIAKDAEAEVYEWQFLALARFLEPEDDYRQMIEEAGEKGRAADKKADAVPVKEAPAVDIGKAVADGIAQGLAAIKKASALLLFCLLLGLGFSARAFDYPAVAGLNGGTNNIVATSTNSYNVAVTNSVIYTNANWSNVNNQWTNQPTYSTNSTVTTPGVFAIGNYDLASLQVSLQLDGAGTTAVPLAFSTSADGVNFVSTFTLSVTPAGTAQKTAITNLSAFAPGWLRLDTIGNANATDITNLSVIVGRKQSRTGP